MDQNSPQNPNVPEQPVPENNEVRNENGIAGKPLYPTLDAQGNTYEAYQAHNAIPTPPPKINIQDDIDALHTESAIPNLRTYESDIADVLKDKSSQTSVVKIAVTQQKKVEATQPQPPKKVSSLSSKKIGSIFITAISSILILGGCAALTLFIIHTIQNRPQPVAPSKPAPIITTESVVDILVPPNENISKTLALQQPKLSGPEGSLVQVVFHEGTSTNGQSMTAETFANRLPSGMPSWLARSFSPTFMVGYQLLATPQPFIIFKTNSYDNAFAGMLNWEATLRNDMQGLQLVETSIATTTGTTTTPVNASAPHGFTDAVIKNKDVRILKDSSGVPLIIYTLPDKYTVVITTNETTLEEILLRLTTSQFVQ